MKSSDKLVTEIHDLVVAQAEGHLTVTMARRLEDIVRGSLEGHQIYVRYIRDTVSLRRWASQPAWKSLAATSVPAQSHSIKDAGRSEGPVTSSDEVGGSVSSPIMHFLTATLNAIDFSPRVLMVLVAGALASYFVVVLALIPLAKSLAFKPAIEGAAALRKNSALQPEDSIGSVAADENVHWSQPDGGPQDSRLQVGKRYQLAAGRAFLRLASGAQVTIDGPAVWRVDSDAKVILESGRLVALVPKRAIGFTVATPTAEVIDLGTEFGLDVKTDGETDVQVVRGSVKVKPSQVGNTSVPSVVQIAAGNAVRIVADRPIQTIPFDPERFASALAATVTASAPAPLGSAGAVTTIPLGNLFDDFAYQGGPLNRAIRSDTFQATADSGDLGVAVVLYGGNPVKEVAPGVKVDLSSVGWDQLNDGAHPVANDAWSSNATALAPGIRLLGKPEPGTKEKILDGIGMHASALLTFSLDDLRAAGDLGRCGFEFVADQVGVNDSVFNYWETVPTLHMVVLVSSATDVLSANVDGQPVKLSKQDDCWKIVSDPGPPLGRSGPHPSVHVAIARGAKYLTLLCSGAGDNDGMDHGVWVGARLEVRP